MGPPCSRQTLRWRARPYVRARPGSALHGALRSTAGEGLWRARYTPKAKSKKAGKLVYPAPPLLHRFGFIQINYESQSVSFNRPRRAEGGLSSVQRVISSLGLLNKRRTAVKLRRA